NQHHKRPEAYRIYHTGNKLAAERFLDPLFLSGAVIVTDQRLSALAHTGNRHGNKLVDAGDDRHGAYGNVAAIARKACVKTDVENAFGRNHHKRRNAQGQTGKDNARFQPKITPPELEDGTFAAQKPKNPE